MTAGPYIVTVKHERGGAARFGSLGEPEVVSRAAVATLENARVEVADLTFQHGMRHNILVAVERAIGKCGGSITLPDGARIEVEATTWARLAGLTEDRTLIRQAQFVGHTQDATVKRAILAAWNAERGTGIGARA